MDLVKLAQSVLSKAEAFSASPASGSHQTFMLREGIRADAQSIIYAIDGPRQTMRAITRWYTVCTALKICLDLDLAQHLPQSPRSLDELADLSGCDARVLRPLLRLLAQYSIFEQTPDDKWQHTAMSEWILDPPFHAWMRQILEEKYRSIAHLPQFLRSTQYRFPSADHTAFMAVYETPLPFYKYINEVDQVMGQNFALSMEDLAQDQLLFFEKNYDFGQLDQGTHFVDVAGGLGKLTFMLAKMFPEATFEVQDQLYTVQEARKACPDEFQDRVTFKEHDMLTPQPPIDRAAHPEVVFLLKIILHDASDADCLRILGSLLGAMQSKDRILIIDTVIGEVGGSLSSCNSDVIAMGLLGAGHRTLKEWRGLIESCGKDVAVEVYSGGTEEADGLMVIEVMMK